MKQQIMAHNRTILCNNKEKTKCETAENKNASWWKMTENLIYKTTVKTEKDIKT